MYIGQGLIGDSIIEFMWIAEILYYLGFPLLLNFEG